MLRLSFLFLLFIGNVIAQDSVAIKRILSFQEELNKEFASEEESPLPPKDLARFTALDFFDIDTTFCVSAKFIRTPYETPFVMKTTTGSEPLYVKFAEAHFILDGNRKLVDIFVLVFAEVLLVSEVGLTYRLEMNPIEVLDQKLVRIFYHRLCTKI